MRDYADGKEPPRRKLADERAGDSNTADCRLHADQRWRGCGHCHARQNGSDRIQAVALSHKEVSERPTARSLKTISRKITIILHSPFAGCEICIVFRLGYVNRLGETESVARVREKLALVSAYNSGLPLGIVADENGVRAREGAPQTENKNQ